MSPTFLNDISISSTKFLVHSRCQISYIILTHAIILFNSVYSFTITFHQGVQMQYRILSIQIFQFLKIFTVSYHRRHRKNKTKFSYYKQLLILLPSINSYRLKFVSYKVYIEIYEDIYSELGPCFSVESHDVCDICSNRVSIVELSSNYEFKSISLETSFKP